MSSFETLVKSTLYYSPGSCSLAPHILLEEVAQPFGRVRVWSDAGQARTPEFLRVNPKGRVPVLVTDDRVLTEAPAILFDIAMSNPDAGLLPTVKDGLVRSIEWFNWLSGSVHAVAVRQIWRPEDFTRDPSQRDGIIASGKEQVASAFALIDDRMSKVEWAVGDQYSLVDPYLLVFYRWGNRMGIPMRNEYKSWTRHTLRLVERPAVMRALKTEDISVWE